MKKMFSTKGFGYLMVCFLIFAFSFSSFVVRYTTVSAAVDSGVYLESGKVYYIKNQKSDLYLDVYGKRTANGSIVKHDYFNGGLNQQFKLVRISGDIYEIIPMHAQDKRLDISDASVDNNTQVQIYTSNSTNAQRFKIVDDENGTGSFKILTGNTGYVKCVTNQYASTTPSNVIQYSYGNDGKNDNDHWYFEKKDKIGVNLEQDVNVGMNSFNEFTLDFAAEYIFQNVSYILETVGSCDTILELYFKGELMFRDDDSGERLNARLTFTPNNVNGITAKVKIYGEKCGNAKLRLRPKNQAYANSYNGDINTMEDVYQIYKHLNKLDLYVNHHVNTTPLRNEVFRNNPEMNNRFYFMTAHGSPGSVKYAPGSRFSYYDLPVMNNVELVVWAVCHGADATSGGKSMVAQSIANGAQNALGWHGVTYVGTSHTFTTYLWENIGNGQTVSNAVNNAVASTRSYYWIKEIGGWGNDPILSPVLVSVAPVTTTSIETDAVLNFDKKDSDLILMSSDAYLNNDSNYARFDSNDGKTIFARKIDGILTNSITVIDGSNSCAAYSKTELNNSNFAYTNAINIDAYRVKDAVVEQFLFIMMNGEYHLVRRTQTIDELGISEIYYDITADNYLPEDFVMNAFDYRGE